MKKIILFLILLCSACKTQDCKTLNHKLIDEFKSKLDIVKRMEDGEKVQIIEYREALIYLSNTTGIMTKADYSSTIGYASTADYERDMKLWKKWLVEHQCLPEVASERK